MQRTDRVQIRRALVSVSNKSGLLDFANGLHLHGIEILSTGGTYRTLINAKIPAIEVSSITDFPEIMNGRLKTLHPKIHGGILGRRDLDKDTMADYGITPIDLVCVNLYPFQEIVSSRQSTHSNAIEHIDIGGPAMVRSAAKNYAFVGIVTSPDQYDDILAEITFGGLTYSTRFNLAKSAFQHTAEYDSTIANYFGSNRDSSQFPEKIFAQFKQHSVLRYGENPHQSAAFYVDQDCDAASLGASVKLSGKPMSFNNISDSDAALECVRQFDKPACVIVKHTNPCGVAIDTNIKMAYEKAYKADPTSAFGGVVAFNRALDIKTARYILNNHFVEVIVTTGIEKGVLDVFKNQNSTIRLLSVAKPKNNVTHYDYRRIRGALLVQDIDTNEQTPESLKTVTNQKPTKHQLDDLLFAWKVAKFVKSNAIVYAKNKQTIGIGAGQMSRIYSTRIAKMKADDAGLKISGSVMASDAFFPFPDSIEEAADAGVSAIIQPGGSIRDHEIIYSANALGIAMVFTGIRHFKH